METTSHFLGLSLKNETFKDLFSGLKEYLNTNKLDKAIEIHKISNLHITLYYFGKNIDKKNLEKIKEDLLWLNHKKEAFPVYINQYNFFVRNKNKYLAYLSPSEVQTFQRINSKLKQRYLSEVPDNNYSKFIPHISLFKTVDNKKYQKHKNNLISIIDKHLKVIEKIDVFRKFNLYSVDSNYSPQKQKIIM